MTNRNLDPRDVFCAALDLTSHAEQDAYVAGACGADQELRERVQALLKADRDAGRFMAEPEPTFAPTVGSPAIAEVVGTRIGPYKLLQQIGEGGFGVVYMAEQHKPVRRKVALKVIKPGMDTKEVVARFEAEQQALAMMDHPNIAKVLDAGTTDSDRPFFVMELVKGIPITNYCDDQRIGTRERLELFMKVCQAVQHAHQKGIIHRDIKPSNVLITEHDGNPVPKVIDFGIAKAINQQLTERTIFTRFQQMVGTPMYMSPEQAQLSGLDVDTRTDIYSLGVLLYELLAGTTPFDKQRFSEAAYDEIRRIIREEDPPKPSTKLSSLGASASEISGRRRTDARHLGQLLRGELDWIVMKALDKERARRYETAHGFASDVQRYLSNETVQACPPSATYRLRKFVRRHKAALATSAIVAAALLLGLVGTSWQSVRATRASHRAAMAEATAERERDFARDAATRANDEASRADENSRRLARQLRRSTARELAAQSAGVRGSLPIRRITSLLEGHTRSTSINEGRADSLRPKQPKRAPADLTEALGSKRPMYLALPAWEAPVQEHAATDICVDGIGLSRCGFTRRLTDCHQTGGATCRKPHATARRSS